MEDQKYYVCKYCFEDYIPTRRHVQKFCSDTCRSKSHHIKNRGVAVSNTKAVVVSDKKKKKTKTKPEKISVVGVGNATGGALLADQLTKAFTSEENKPATKGDLQTLAKYNIQSLATKSDIQALLNKMERYHKVQNMQPNQAGKFPYFDMETKMVVYL
jgi:hypothetical protein